MFIYKFFRLMCTFVGLTDIVKSGALILVDDIPCYANHHYYYYHTLNTTTGPTLSMRYHPTQITTIIIIIL